MTDPRRSTELTTVRAVTEAAAGRVLRVMGAAGLVSRDLPAEGVWTVGRAETADVRVDDPSVSRLHCRLHLGRAVVVEDLGSANGTRVGARKLSPGERVECPPGSTLAFGSALGGLFGPAAAAVEAPPSGPLVADPAMEALYATLARAARGDIPVLLLGETGVGKEVVAARLHALSPRAARPCVKLNCAALSDALVESELFGHEKGAFTGAFAAHAGLIESAAGGTVFLDEVGELSPAVQAKLLRVLEDRRVRRVGSVKDREVDARFVAATNRDLLADIKAGRFREDLYFRLGGFVLHIPPLRERRAEILPLARRLVAQSALAQRRNDAPALSPAAEAALLAYRWPGNIRELRHVVDRAVLLCDGPLVGPEHLPPERFGEVVPTPATPPTVDAESTERDRILAVLARCAGNQSTAAKELGMTRRMLVLRLDRYGIARPRKGRERGP